jgi:hypothetical protein
MTSNQPEWIRAARQFGAEAGEWASMSKEDQEAARKAFYEGVQAEMKNHA